MKFTATRFPYQQTGHFSKIITDYLDQADSLRPFYKHPVTVEGIQSAIQARQQFDTDRGLLVEELRKQYHAVETRAEVNANIDRLLQDNCFTITTAHQPAIFTGSLYFIYKILHIIKLANHLAAVLPQYQFVPVFYMGCEDADLDELGKIYLDGEKIAWDTKQTGAVGRMKTKGLEKLMNRIEGEYSVQAHGPELVQLLKDCYLGSENIQTATFRLLNTLFAEYGLIVLIPDNANLKRRMIPVFKDDLFHQTASQVVEKTIDELSRQYKVQANPREINLFYLKDDLRQRIIADGAGYKVQGTNIEFSKDGLEQELEQYPERFSPNVILRGLFQETILPNIAFIGGGGETAYWLELKNLFEQYKTPFPVLILRNSFLIVEKKWNEKLEKAGLNASSVFRPADDLINELVKKESRHQLNLEREIASAHDYYENLKSISQSVDPSLSQHVEALQSKALRPLKELEKKLLKAEKRKFQDRYKQVHSIKAALFPLNSLQERIDNFMPYYAKWGKEFIEVIYKNSLTLEQEFVVLEEE
jgi:bacillithiol biosynthesis cysteine-adding enzyme BshC